MLMLGMVPMAMAVGTMAMGHTGHTMAIEVWILGLGFTYQYYAQYQNLQHLPYTADSPVIS